MGGGGTLARKRLFFWLCILVLAVAKRTSGAQLTLSYQTCLYKGHLKLPSWGTPDFKWQGWSDGWQKSKPQKIPKAAPNKTSKKNPGPKSKPKKSDAEYMSHKDFQKALNIKKILKKKVGCTKVAELRDRDTWALSRIFWLFWIPKQNYLLKKRHPKKYLQNVPTSNYSSPKRSVDYPRHHPHFPPPPTSPG